MCLKQELDPSKNSISQNFKSNNLELQFYHEFPEH